MLSPHQRVAIATIIVSFSCGLLGWDIGTIGSITTMPQFLGRFGTLTPLFRGLVVAIILLPSSVTGFFGGTVADKISRKYTVGLGCFIFSVGSALSAASNSLGLLLFARCVAGGGEGLFLSAGSVYIAEICPAHLRGIGLLVTQVFICGGISFGFFACYGSIQIESSWSWRLPFVTSALTGFIVAVATHFIPYSPRYLLLRGRREEAERVMDLLVDPAHASEREGMLRVGQAAPEAKSAPMDMFKKGVRGRTILIIFLNMANQLTGIDFVLFFAPLLFAQAGLDPHTASFVASGATGLVLLVVVLIGATYVDKVGRRALFISGGLLVGSCQLLLGCMYASGAASKPAGKWVVVVLIELFTVTYAATWALVTFVYSNEICPSRVRSTAVSASRGANQLTNFVVAMTGPAFLAKSAYGPYFFYGGITLFAALVAWLFCQETVGKTLETIDDSFDDSSYAIQLSWSQIFSPYREARQRKRSHSETRTLPGAVEAERTRAHFRTNLVDLYVIGGGSVAIE